MIKLSKILNQLRTYHSLTLVEIANSINVSVEKLNQYENGVDLPTEEEIEKIADFYNITVIDLLNANQLYKKTYVNKIENDLDLEDELDFIDGLEFMGTEIANDIILDFKSKIKKYFEKKDEISEEELKKMLNINLEDYIDQ